MSLDVSLNCPCCDSTLFDANITHNLTLMASECGLYIPCWSPEKQGWTVGEDLIQPLTDGLAKLHNNADRCRELNPKNGWGNYEGLVSFVEKYLAACKQFPKAKIQAWA